MKTGRNDPCPCGSGKKYKHCCFLIEMAEAQSPREIAWRRVRREIEGLGGRIIDHALDIYGDAALDEAWEEFHFWDDAEDVYDPEGPDQGLFLSWFIYRWVPDGETSATRDSSLFDVPPARHYLDHRGARLAPIAREYVESCLAGALSFYEVERTDPGKSVTVQDVFSGERHEVLERTASQSLGSGDLIYACLARADGVTLFEIIGETALPPIDKIELIELRKKIRRAEGTLDIAALRMWDMELRECYLALSERLWHPELPLLQTSDGNAIELHKLVFDIDSAETAFEALRDLVGHHDRIERDDEGRLQRAEFPWTRQTGTGATPDSNLVLGAITIGGGRIQAEVMSRERAEAFRTLVEERLGASARFRVDRVQSVESLLAESAAGARQPEREDPADPEMIAASAAFLADYYARWIDMPIPALGGRTPRKAVRDPDGREQVAALIDDLARKGVQPPAALDPAIIERLRRELGLDARDARS